MRVMDHGSWIMGRICDYNPTAKDEDFKKGPGGVPSRGGIEIEKISRGLEGSA